MQALVIYDSVYGSTEQVARAIGMALGEGASVLRLSEARASALTELDLLVVGGPTHCGRPRPELKAFLESIPSGDLVGVKVAAFDTRVGAALVKLFGYAAPRIAEALRQKGGTLAADPEPFVVRDKDGPLKEGELERASSWARSLCR